MEYTIKTDFATFVPYWQEKQKKKSDASIAKRNLIISLATLIGAILSVFLLFRFILFDFIGIGFYGTIGMAILSFISYVLYFAMSVRFSLFLSLAFLLGKTPIISKSVKEVNLHVSPTAAKFAVSFSVGKHNIKRQLKDISKVIETEDLYVLVIEGFRGVDKDADYYLSRRKRYTRAAYATAFLFRRMYHYIPFSKEEIEQYPEVKEALLKISKDLRS